MSSREKHTCHDCGINEGEIHQFGCDMEVCPFCGGQAIGCECAYKQLGIDCSPGTDVYENGLNKEQEAEWLIWLNTKGRIPYIQWPWVCARCGVLWPDMFMVPQEEWDRYIQPDMRDCILCRSCYDEIKHLINKTD